MTEIFIPYYVTDRCSIVIISDENIFCKEGKIRTNRCDIYSQIRLNTTLDNNNSMTEFATISDVNLLALKNNNRITDVVDKKQSILDHLAQYYNLAPTKILFVGFSSFVLANYSDKIYITSVGKDVLDYLTEQRINYEYIPEIELLNYRKQFEVVVAVDEYFTFAGSDNEQKDLVAQICNLATDFVITTLRDYKNQDYKEREFSQPTIVKRGTESLLFLENHTWSQSDRANWSSMIYAIDQQTNTMETFGDFTRRTMYFKQLANFTASVGALDFVVHKTLMYKGLIRKNYEHVITITFN
jgi:hypothetical protein